MPIQIRPATPADGAAVAEIYAYYVAETAITFGSAAGNCGGDFGPRLPEAATSTAPRAWAASSARARPGSAGPVKLMLMTRAFRLAA